MSMIHILFLGTLMAGLLMWGGNRLRPAVTDEKSRKRWLSFLLGGLSLSLVALMVAASANTYIANLSLVALLPITVGFAAEVILYFSSDRDIRSQEALKMLPLVTLVLVVLTWITISNTREILLVISLGSVLTALAWLAWGRAKKWFWVFYTIEILLLGFSIWAADTNRLEQMYPQWLMAIVSFGTFAVIPGSGIIMAALLIREPLLDEQSLNWRALTSQVLLAAILLALIAFRTFLLSIWDVATDGLGGILMVFLTGIVAIGSAMLMAWSMPRRRTWAAVLFALSVPAIMRGAMHLGTYDTDGKWGTMPHIMTERHAEAVERAIQRYYEGNRQYPQALSDLSPRYILYIPNPYIIPGQDWCYESSGDHYRFGYVYREYFSTAASAKIYSSAGEPPAPNWDCEKEADKYPMPGSEQP